MVHRNSWFIYILNMVIFHSYVKLPEGKTCSIWMFDSQKASVKWLGVILNKKFRTYASSITIYSLTFFSKVLDLGTWARPRCMLAMVFSSFDLRPQLSAVGAFSGEYLGRSWWYPQIIQAVRPFLYWTVWIPNFTTCPQNFPADVTDGSSQHPTGPNMFIIPSMNITGPKLQANFSIISFRNAMCAGLHLFTVYAEA